MSTEKQLVRRTNFVTRRIAGETVVVPVLAPADVSPTGERLDFLVLNEAGELLWERLQRNATVPDLAHELIATYGIPAEAAANDAAAFVASLREIHALLEIE